MILRFLLLTSVVAVAFVVFAQHNHDHHSHSHGHQDGHNPHQHEHTETEEYERVHTNPTKARTSKDLISIQLDRLRDEFIHSLASESKIPNLMANTMDLTGGPFYRTHMPIIPFSKTQSPKVCRGEYSEMYVFTHPEKCSPTFGCWGERDLLPAEHLFVSGHVYARSKSGTMSRVSNAIIDLWQPNPLGEYSTASRLRNSTECRAAIETDSNGAFHFQTYKPGQYGMMGLISDFLIRQDIGIWIPSHIHIVVWAPGFKPLVTQLHFAGDATLDFDLRESGGEDLGSHDDRRVLKCNASSTNGVLKCSYDFVLNQLEDESERKKFENRDQALFEYLCVNNRASLLNSVVCNPIVIDILHIFYQYFLLQIAFVGIIFWIFRRCSSGKSNKKSTNDADKKKKKN